MESSTRKSCQSVKKGLYTKTKEVHVRFRSLTTQSNNQVIECNNWYPNKEEDGRTYLEVKSFTMKE